MRGFLGEGGEEAPEVRRRASALPPPGMNFPSLRSRVSASGGLPPDRVSRGTLLPAHSRSSRNRRAVLIDSRVEDSNYPAVTLHAREDPNRERESGSGQTDSADGFRGGTRRVARRPRKLTWLLPSRGDRDASLDRTDRYAAVRLARRSDSPSSSASSAVRARRPTAIAELYGTYTVQRARDDALETPAGRSFSDPCRYAPSSSANSRLTARRRNRLASVHVVHRRLNVGYAWHRAERDARRGAARSGTEHDQTPRLGRHGMGRHLFDARGSTFDMHPMQGGWEDYRYTCRNIERVATDHVTVAANSAVHCRVRELALRSAILISLYVATWYHSRFRHNGAWTSLSLRLEMRSYNRIANDVQHFTTRQRWFRRNLDGFCTMKNWKCIHFS